MRTTWFGRRSLLRRFGQIVNREFNAVTTSGNRMVSVRLPVPAPRAIRGSRAALRGETQGVLNRQRWEPDKAGRELTALERISFYYPECVDKLALELIKAHYDILLIWKFAPSYQTESRVRGEQCYVSMTR